MADRILVTGGMGFLGRHLLPALTSAGHEVRVMDVYDAPWREASVEFIRGTFDDEALLAPALEGCAAVVHMASSTIPRTSNEDPAADIQTNLSGAVRLLEACRKAGCSRFVFTSSGGTVYGDVHNERITEDHPTEPISSYGIVKLAVEKYMAMYGRLYGMKTASLRIANLYGEHQRHDSGLGAIAAFTHRIVTGNPVEIWGDGSVARDFVYVGDVVLAVLAALKTGKPGLVANIGSGRAVSLNEILDMIEVTAGCASTRNYLPGRSFDVQRTCLDIGRAKSELGWQPQQALNRA